LGFWFAQQGAIYVFVTLIFVYAWRIQIIERQFGVDDDADNDVDNEVDGKDDGDAKTERRA
ncbi:MAG: DUF4212 domain-containing protein, partial [Pseudomonadales bacterium]|nr:DUF4212 domain-containing protein [Pseudomonadales bacterium]